MDIRTNTEYVVSAVRHLGARHDGMCHWHFTDGGVTYEIAAAGLEQLGKRLSDARAEWWQTVEVGTPPAPAGTSTVTL